MLFEVLGAKTAEVEDDEEAADPIDPADEPASDEEDQVLRVLVSDAPATKRTVLAGPSSGKPPSRPSGRAKVGRRGEFEDV